MSRPSPVRLVVRLAVAAAVITVAVLVVAHLLRPVAVTTTAQLGKAIRAVPGSVEVEAEYAQELKSEVAGRVGESMLDIGLRVEAGDVLVRLDSGDVDLEIARIRHEITAARRRVELGSTLRADLLNKRDLVTNLGRQVQAGAASAADLEREQRLLQQLEQRVELDEVNLRLALETFENLLQAKEREKSKMVITSPLTGVVTAVLARPGDLIGGNSPIATIITTTRTVMGRLSEENFAAVRLGQPASVRFLTYGKDQYRARVAKLLPSADPATQRYTVHLDVFLPEGRTLVPGLTGEVSIVIAERDGAVIIPRRALVGDQVYVVENGRVTRRKVERGYESLNEVEILTGLAAGEVVVVEQQDRFRDGDRVRVQSLTN